MIRSETHATFSIERTYDTPPARVFKAFSDEETKQRWFGGPAEWERSERSMDFRVGGIEINTGGPKGGTRHSFRARYHDIVPNERIIYAYDLLLDDRHISVSLTTVTFRAAGKGTLLTFTEQGVFLDGYDDAGSREEGTRGLLDNLGAYLKREGSN